jgi:hypothetical protein
LSHHLTKKGKKNTHTHPKQNKDISFLNLTNILDKADDAEPTYTDDSIGIQEPGHGTCEVQRDGMVIYIGMLER